MKSLLTEQDIRYLLEQQERLDQDIREKFSINDTEWIEMNVEHDIALRVEVAEFVNACYKSWKYWKSKPMDRSQILDEAIDVIHFVMLHYNNRFDLNFVTELVFQEMHKVSKIDNEDEVKSKLHLILKIDSRFELLSRLLAILDFYDFDRKQIMQAYKEKNKVNFERLAKEY